MKNATLLWCPVSGITAVEPVEFGTRDEIKKVYFSYPEHVRSYEGVGEVRDRVNHKNISVHVAAVPSGDGGTRLLAYPVA